MKVSFRTFGCKLNQAETDMLKKDLKDKGFFIVSNKSKADVSVIRGCGVTCSASQRTREAIRQAKRAGAYIIVNGCVENIDLPEIDFVARTMGEVVSQAEKLLKSEKLLDNNEHNYQDNINVGSKTRQFVKIQTGCNFQCAYCIIPTFRGKSDSEPVDKIIEYVRISEKNDFQEIVLTGINIGQYSYNNTNLSGLLKIILQKTDIPRIRLGSLDPRLIDDNFIDLYKNEARLMPHWHLSLQSGSNSVLKRMGRGYSAEKYLDIVDRVKAFNPLFSFTTDIIIGFPGETDEEFKETCDFVRQVGFSKVHLFPFSPRPGTPATKLKPVQNNIVSDRVNKLTKIVNEVSNEYKQKLVGNNSKVLFESQKNGYWFGYCAEYVRIKRKIEKDVGNKIVKVKIKKDDFV